MSIFRWLWNYNTNDFRLDVFRDFIMYENIKFLVKRFFEKPKRPLMIWCLDTFKQIFGQSLQHCLSLFISDSIGADYGTQCEWYLMVVAFDCTLGVFFSYLIQKLILGYLEGTKFHYKTGIYTVNEDQTFDEDHLKIDYKIFILQICVWSVVVLIVNIWCLFINFYFFK